MTPPLLQLNPADAPSLLQLSESIGWPHQLADWQNAFAASRVYGHKLDDGTVVSSSAIYKFDSALAALAVVIVREDFRGKGLARAAVLACLREVPDTPVMLVATEFGEPLYLKLGFRVVEQIIRLVAPNRPSSFPATACTPMTVSELSLALDLDLAAYGADRSAILALRWHHVERGMMLPGATGFAWLVRQRGTFAIGPVIAPSPGEAVSLIGALTRDLPGPFKLEVPDSQTTFIETLRSAGFSIESSRALMLKNAEELPGERSRIYALASLGYG